ncbi:MAG: AAA family ATPase [Sulfurimonas sp.]|nr:AAA family ATPase [Sulfurimonas sp.]
MQLIFYKKQRGFRIPESCRLSVYLILDNWNDFSYRTLYQITLFDENGIKHDLGYVKIANFGQTTDERIELEEEFEQLDDRYFSLGQSDEYYSIIQDLNPQLKELFLIKIKDIVFDQELQSRALQESVTQTSLLRDTSLVTLNGQYRRILDGGAILTQYNFSYRTIQTATEAGYQLSFNVEPESNPPTNVHVLIGRNGVGKTHLLNNMVKSFISSQDAQGEFQQVVDVFGNSVEFFSKVMSVSYSAFDPFKPYKEREYPSYSYIGLKKEDVETIKNHDELAQEFFNSINHCFSVGKKEKWLNAVRSLESDPLFNEINITQLIESTLNERRTKQLYKRLSSGHSIVLLTITRLVEKIEEKTLVLLDEPEAHLHPPLLSAFIRALSDLLINRNAVAIIATHSPVIAQEIPKSCIWKLSRFGLEANAERFESETFGETIGKLTREVFGLEVNESGFYKLLNEDVVSGKSYEQIIQKYNDQLGIEAKLLLRALLNNSGESL